MFDAETIIKYAAKLLIGQLETFADLDRGASDIDGIAQKGDQEINPVLMQGIEDLELPVRSQNCLKQSRISRIGDLVTKSERDLMKIPHLGKKSMSEIKVALAQFNLELDTNIPGWPPQGR